MITATLKLAEECGLGKLADNGLWIDYRATYAGVLKFAESVAALPQQEPKPVSPDVNLFDLFEAGWAFHSQIQGHVLDGRDVCRLTVSEFWPEYLRDMWQGNDLHVGLTVSEAVVKVKQEVKRRLDALAAPQEQPRPDVLKDLRYKVQLAYDAAPSVREKGCYGSVLVEIDAAMSVQSKEADK